MRSYLDPYGGADRSKDIYYVFYVLRYLPIGKQVIVDEITDCASPREIESMISRLRPLFSDEYSPGTREVAAQLSPPDMTEGNIRLLVITEFDEFFNLLAMTF